MFYAGTLLFSGASLVCAIAPTAGTLVAARALQGIGGAILSPATLAIITTSFDEGAPRNRALGAWGAVGAIGATAGVLLGGILTEAFSWPAIFVINIPIGLGIVLFSRRLIPEGRSESENRHFDLPGAVLVTARDDGADLRDRHHRPARLGRARRARPGRGRSGPARGVRASTRTASPGTRSGPR